MKIRIDDEYSNLGQDLNIILSEYSQNDVSEQEDIKFGEESSYYNNNDNLYERLDNNESNVEIQHAEETSYKNSLDQNYSEYDKGFEKKCEEECETYEENCNNSNGKIKVSVKLGDNNGVEIRGAKVNLYKLNGVSPKLNESKLTDFKGEVIFDDLANGCYRVISLVDRKFFEKPLYTTWNEVTIDDCIKDANICVVNKIKSSCYKAL